MPPDDLPAPKRSGGRPLAFDRLKALSQAMRLFWERGYEGAVYDDLLKAMNISGSSFYNTFGSKEQLFREALACHMSEPGDAIIALAGQADARAAFQAMLDTSATTLAREGFPSGGLMALLATHISPNLRAQREEIGVVRQAALNALIDRLNQGVTAGDLPASTDVEGLAHFYETVLRGMAVKARDGASRGQLQRVATMAMKAWPARRPARRSGKHNPNLAATPEH